MLYNVTIRNKNTGEVSTVAVEASSEADARFEAGERHLDIMRVRAVGVTSPTHKQLHGRCEDAPCCGCCGQQDERWCD